jgi:hypothetical protein
VVLTVDGLRLTFQLVDEFAAPTWPNGERPQQFHLDVTVDDVDAVEPRVLALGGYEARSTARPGSRRLVQGVPRPGRPPLLPLLGLIRASVPLSADCDVAVAECSAPFATRPSLWEVTLEP